MLKDNWNSIFVDFVRREWVKEKSPNKGAPTQMHRNWQPSSDAYEVLELANIPKNVSQSYILEFVLFWEEDGVALKSWNSKFVDFVKRKEIVNTINNEERCKKILENVVKEDEDVLKNIEKTINSDGDLLKIFDKSEPGSDLIFNAFTMILSFVPFHPE